MEFLISPEIWLSLITLTFLEIVLGIDNVVFVSVAADRLPPERRQEAARLGIWSGAGMRILMLFGLVWLTELTHATLFNIPEFLHFMGGDPSSESFDAFQHVTLEDIILLLGGVFLLWKGTTEIHHALEGHIDASLKRPASGFVNVILQMTAINVVFSLDSVLTAVGMTRDIGDGGFARMFVMVAAVVLSTVVMVASAEVVRKFLERHQTTKMLALSFIMLVGVALVADGLGFHIPRGYLYFAIVFSLAVEVLNVMQQRRRLREKSVDVH